MIKIKIVGNEDMISNFHCKYIAYDLEKINGKGLERLSQSLFNSNVDLNPHQVEAALFAIRSPFSKGVLLADEVGLGKTIEAGLVISQFWAERKRKILIISPASIRKQWQVELEEKFSVPCRIIDSKIYNKLSSEGHSNPFESNEIVIASLHYCSRKSEDIRSINWDLVVIDEAHKLRNSHRQSNKIGQNIKWATEDKRKILLTATPLQNSLIELYGISSVIDEKIFGDLPTFRTLYANIDGDIDDLKGRLSSFCQRTLRKNVVEFVKFTNRQLITVDFNASDEEQKLYNAVSAFLQRDDTYAFPKRQKHLIVMIVRKVMASSPFALSGTLEVIKKRLLELQQSNESQDLITSLLDNTTIDDETLEELLLEEDDEEIEIVENTIDQNKLEDEIKEIEKLILWTKSIGIDSKTMHLLKALEIGYARMKEFGAEQKAVIFTESRRTQDYLKVYLESNGYFGQVVTFSGSNKDSNVKDIYQSWLDNNLETGQISGSKAIDVRHAIVDYFKHHAKIMIATEAGAEGINLQFCSLMVNFDLPWNPQRIEQRIGRIHRYGQKHDVVVINFLNKRNAADQRVYDLLRYKFNLFEGVFGSSDEVLGQLEKAANLENKILEIYQLCRSESEIQIQFDLLQKELDKTIKTKLIKTRELLFEHFDEDVHKKIKIDYEDALKTLDDYGLKFWRLSKHVLKEYASFNDNELEFHLKKSPIPGKWKGKYQLISKRKESKSEKHLYNMNHSIGKFCLSTAKNYNTSSGYLEFDLSNYDSKITVLENLKNKSGWMILRKMTIESIEKEEFLLFSGFTDNGENIDSDVLETFFRLDCAKIADTIISDKTKSDLLTNNKLLCQAVARKSLEDNNKLFLERREQLYRWAEDVVLAAERNLKQLKTEIRAAERDAGLATTIEEQKQAQEKIENLEKKKRKARRDIFDTEDKITEKRNFLIKQLEKKIAQNIHAQELFTIKWKIV